MSNPKDLSWYRTRLEAFSIGSLSDEEMQAVEAFLETDDASQLGIPSDSTLTEMMGQLSPASCPDHVVKSAELQLRQSSGGFRLPSRWWVGSLASLGLVLAVWIAIPNSPPPSEQFSDAEVEQAVQQLQWALGFVGEVSNETGMLVDDVIEKRVAAPMVRTLPFE